MRDLEVMKDDLWIMRNKISENNKTIPWLTIAKTIAHAIRVNPLSVASCVEFYKSSSKTFWSLINRYKILLVGSFIKNLRLAFKIALYERLYIAVELSLKVLLNL